MGLRLTVCRTELIEVVTEHELANESSPVATVRMVELESLCRLRELTELSKQFSDNNGFKRWLSDTIFRLTYQDTAA